MTIIHRDPGDETSHQLPICNVCGEIEVSPGEDQCWKCLGLPEPSIVWGDDINERVADFSRIGTEEWIEEMKANWPLPLRGY